MPQYKGIPLDFSMAAFASKLNTIEIIK